MSSELDEDGYPTNYLLRTVRKFKFAIPEDVDDFIDLICRNWYYNGCELKDGILNLHTYGWSGNEMIMAAIGENKLFFGMCWLKSERGGHYVFDFRQLKEALKPKDKRK